MVKTSVLVTSFFFFGAVIGVVLGPAFDSDPPAIVDTSGDREEAAKPTAPEPPPLQPVSVDTTRAVTDSDVIRPAEARSGQFENLGEALEAIKIPTYRPGNSSFSGSVKDKDGNPVEGALVRAVVARVWERTSSSVEQLKPLDVELERDVLEYVSDRYFARDTTVDARTDVDGMYVLEGLHGHLRYTVDAYKRHWEFESAPGTHRTEELPGGEIHFIAKPRIAVPVQVTFTDGSEPYKALVYWDKKDSSSSGSERWFPHHPEIVLRPGTYELKVKAGDEREFGSEEKHEVTVDIDTELEPVAFTIRVRPGVRGRVRFPEGEAPDSVDVFLSQMVDGEPLDDKSVLSGDRDGTRKSDGFDFAFKDLSPGTYVLGVSRDRKRLVASETIEISDSLIDRDLEVPALGRDEYIVLWVREPDGTPTTSVNVQVNYVGSDGNHIGGNGSTMKRKDGSIWAIFEPKDLNAEIDQAILTVMSQKYGMRNVEFSPRDRELEVQFVEPAVLVATIEGYQGSIFEGRMRLNLTAPGGSGSGGGFSPQGFTTRGGRSAMMLGAMASNASRRGGGLKSDGTQTFRPLDPGDYELQVLFKTKRGYQEVDRLAVSVRSGDNDVSVGLPQLYSLTVVTANLTEGTRLDLRATQGGGSARATTDADGIAVFEELGAGEYVLSARGAGAQGQMTIQVPTNGDVRFEPQPINAMTVRSVDSESALGKAGLQAGDVIIGVDGTEFTNQQQMQGLLMAARFKPETTLNVDRDGRAVDIVVTGIDPNDPRSFQADMRPATR